MQTNMLPFIFLLIYENLETKPIKTDFDFFFGRTNFDKRLC